MAVTVGVVPGYGGGAQGYAPLTDALIQAGTEVLFFPSLRRGGNQFSRMHGQGWPMALERQAAHIVQTLDDRGINDIILLGHSCGGAISAIVAAQVPNKVRRVLMLCSSGLHSDSLVRLAWRLIVKMRIETKYARTLGAPVRDVHRLVRLEGLRYVTANPWRSLAEGRAIAGFRIIDVVAAAGVEVYYIGGKRDVMFTPSRLQAALGHLEPERFFILDISHDPQSKPAETAILMEALTQRRLLSHRAER